VNSPLYSFSSHFRRILLAYPRVSISLCIYSIHCSAYTLLFAFCKGHLLLFFSLCRFAVGVQPNSQDACFIPLLLHAFCNPHLRWLDRAPTSLLCYEIYTTLPCLYLTIHTIPLQPSIPCCPFLFPCSVILNLLYSFFFCYRTIYGRLRSTLLTLLETCVGSSEPPNVLIFSPPFLSWFLGFTTVSYTHSLFIPQFFFVVDTSISRYQSKALFTTLLAVTPLGLGVSL